DLRALRSRDFTVRRTSQLALDVECAKRYAFARDRDVGFVFGSVSNDAHRVLAALDLLDLFEHQVAEQDDALVRGAEALGGAVADLALRDPGHHVLPVDRLDDQPTVLVHVRHVTDGDARLWR